MIVYAESSISQDNPASKIVRTRDVIRDVSTHEAFSMALKCVQECIRSHDGCIKPQAPVLPTRVIDCQYPMRPKLITTNYEKGEYLTLSYVWGEPQPHSTTTLNIALYHDFIDPACLPQTIQDAISTTNALGFRYLWADTLCIVQDSVEDKVREIAQMARIYTNAFLTIIAASSSKVSEGFLQKRADLLPPDVILPFMCPGNQTGTVHLFDPLRLQGLPPDPVGLRAWCLQESALSPRALVFSSYTLQYHCNAGITNVGGAVSPWTPETEKRFPKPFFEMSSTEALPAVMEDKEWYELRKKWWRNLTDYTHRSVTNPADKLVALAGVAQQCQRIYCTQYLAGLWEDALLKDLLWSSSHRTEPPRPETYRAPSWSWAAIDGPVGDIDGYTTRSKCIQTCAQVIRCEVVPSKEELPFGEIHSGTLVLRARIVEARLSMSETEPSRGRVYIPWMAYHRLLRRGKDSRAWSTRLVELLSPKVFIGDAKMDSSDDYHSWKVWVLVIWTNAEFSGAEGLLLVPVGLSSSAGCMQYRRVGHYQQRYPNGGVLDCPDFRWLGWLSGAPEVDIEVI
jgi:hypothetical protein